MWADDIIISQNIRIRGPHENVRVEFKGLSTLRSGLKKILVSLSQNAGSAYTIQNVCEYSYTRLRVDRALV